MRPQKGYYHFDAARYPPAVLRLPVDEDRVQAAVLTRLRHFGACVFPVDAGARLLQGRAFGALKRAGLNGAALIGQTGVGAAGLSDIVGAMPPAGRAIFIEVKRPAVLGIGKSGALVTLRPAGVVTRAQEGFLRAMERTGAIVGVTWWWTDVDEILRPRP